MPGEGENHGRMIVTPALVLATAASVLGSTFQFGYNLAVIDNPKEAVQDYFISRGDEFSDFEWSVVVSIFCAGGLVGGLYAGEFSNKVGRKNALLANNLFILIGAGLMCFAVNWGMIAAGRFFVGIGSGAALLAVPMYLSEIAPSSFRGALGTFTQLGITIGILAADVAGMHWALGNEDRWRFMFGLTIVPCFFQAVTLPFAPESPWHLFATSREVEAEAALRRLRGASCQILIAREIAEMKVEAANAKAKHRTSLEASTKQAYKVLLLPELRMPMLVAIVLQIAQQLTGINACYYYGNSIFDDAGVSNGDVATTLVAVVNIFATLLSAHLVERFGRRKTMIGGLGGMAVAYGILTVSMSLSHVKAMGYISVAAIMLCVVSFAFGPGPVPLLMVPEIVPMESRAQAMTVASIVNWLSNLCIGLVFPPMNDALGPRSFIPFLGMAVICIAVLYFTMPETKGLTYPEVENTFRRMSFARVSAGMKGGAASAHVGSPLAADARAQLAATESTYLLDSETVEV